jgi:uncharacterized protein YdeI (YjbR/CyaY-like superfamily)
MEPEAKLLVADAAAWRDWLERHHADTPSAWVVLAKKGVSAPTMLSYEDALLEALCYGWIDGQSRRRDDATFLQRFTPRRTRSPWSATNIERVERLLAEGRMRPAGLDAVERAKAGGQWPG